MEYTYQLVPYYPPLSGINNNVIKRLPDDAYIPNDPENSDWVQYQIWLSQGNLPLPPEGN